MSKTSLKGSRISSLFEQLEKLNISSDGKMEEKELDQLRSVSNKLQQVLNSSPERSKRELISKRPDYVSVLLTLLEYNTDSTLNLNLISSLSELVSAGVVKRATLLANRGCVDILFSTLVNGSKDVPLNDELLVLTHTVLAKIGSKDRKFCVKARLSGAIHVTMNLIKNNTTNFKVLQPTLQVLKVYVSNSVNCNILSKSGAVNVLFRIVQYCGHKRLTCLKLVLEVLAVMVKRKSSASKAVSYGAVPSLLQMISEWQRTDHHNRQTAVRKSLLSVLKSLVTTNVGKKAFVQSDGIKILYHLSLESLECKELDKVNNISSQILRRSFPKNRLPIPTVQHPLTFPAPDEDATESDPAPIAGVNVKDDIIDKSDESSSSESTCSEDEEAIADSIEDISGSTKKNSKANNNSSETGRQKERDDLDIYDIFFPELYEFQAELEEPSESSSKKMPIYIPTAPVDPTPSPANSTGSLCSLSGECQHGVGGTLCNSSQESCHCSNHVFKSVSSPMNMNGSNLYKNQSTNGGQNDCISSDDNMEQDRSIKVHTVLPVVKIPHPEICGHYPPMDHEPIGSRKTSSLQRSMVFKDFERLIQPQKVIDKVVYDLDALINSQFSSSTNTECSEISSKNSSRRRSSNLSCQDGDKMIISEAARPLKFESRFECGNLRKAIQVRDYEYDLILNPDINCKSQHQWFYFEVSNMEADVPYKFNIVNCEKINSQFNFGMQPVLYSSQEALEGHAGWVRTGSSICYYGNYFARSSLVTGGVKGKSYYTATFTVTFPYSNDVCYLAYHFPYSYSMLQKQLTFLESKLDHSNIFYRRQTLCHTLAGNPCDLITITSYPNKMDLAGVEAFRNKPYIFLTARVHPGESNASWVMKGTIDFLLSKSLTAQQLRDTFIFKIVPMLNPDGVINGSHRCSLTGEDLNRKWLNPHPVRNPTIYHTKGLLQYLKFIDRAPLVYCDYHGHSRKKNVFMYGCSTAATVAAATNTNVEIEVDEEMFASDPLASDTVSPEPRESQEQVYDSRYADVTRLSEHEDTGYRTLPRVLHATAPAFSLHNCSFIVEKCKETTARVVVWREIGVIRSYTMESTYCGCDQGPYKGWHIGTRELEEMGRYFCAGLLRLGGSVIKKHNGLRRNDSSSSSVLDVESCSYVKEQEELRLQKDDGQEAMDALQLRKEECQDTMEEYPEDETDDGSNDPTDESEYSVRDSST